MDRTLPSFFPTPSYSYLEVVKHPLLMLVASFFFFFFLPVCGDDIQQPSRRIPVALSHTRPAASLQLGNKKKRKETLVINNESVHQGRILNIISKTGRETFLFLLVEEGEGRQGRGLREVQQVVNLLRFAAAVSHLNANEQRHTRCL